MLLIAVGGLSWGEAAETIGVPVGTGTNRFSRARQAIGRLSGERGDQKNEMNRKHKGIVLMKTGEWRMTNGVCGRRPIRIAGQTLDRASWI